jgi:hypothetical protein
VIIKYFLIALLIFGFYGCGEMSRCRNGYTDVKIPNKFYIGDIVTHKTGVKGVVIEAYYHEGCVHPPGHTALYNVRFYVNKTITKNKGGDIGGIMIGPFFAGSTSGGTEEEHVLFKVVQVDERELE